MLAVHSKLFCSCFQGFLALVLRMFGKCQLQTVKVIDQHWCVLKKKNCSIFLHNQVQTLLFESVVYAIRSAISLALVKSFPLRVSSYTECDVIEFVFLEETCIDIFIYIFPCSTVRWNLLSDLFIKLLGKLSWVL